MVRVLRDFRRRRISPANRQRKAAEWGGRQAPVKRSSNARQAHAMFPEMWLAGNYRQTRVPG
eukprot:15992834-Heterocapsa_arctica.AAC.1